MAIRKPGEDGCVSLDVANKDYMKNNKLLDEQMGGAQRAAHRAVDIAFGRMGQRPREVKSQRAVPFAPSTKTIPSGTDPSS